jgi:hypothetical protein
MKNQFCLHLYPDYGRIIDFDLRKTHASIGYAVFSILKARKRLKAICRNSASSTLLISAGQIPRRLLRRRE